MSICGIRFQTLLQGMSEKEIYDSWERGNSKFPNLPVNMVNTGQVASKYVGKCSSCLSDILHVL